MDSPPPPPYSPSTRFPSLKIKASNFFDYGDADGGMSVTPSVDATEERIGSRFLVLMGIVFARISRLPLSFFGFVHTISLFLCYFLMTPVLPFSPFFLSFPFHPGSRGSREEQRGSAPRGAKDVAFQSEHLQPPGVNPGCPSVPVEYQTLYHMSGNHGST